MMQRVRAKSGMISCIALLFESIKLLQQRLFVQPIADGLRAISGRMSISPRLSDRLRALSRTVIAVLLSSMIVLAGCSINEFGVVDARTLPAGEGVTRHILAPGMHLNTRENTVSLTLGLLRTTGVYAPPCSEQLSSNFSFLADSFRRELQLSHSHAIGLHIAMSAQELSFTLGSRELLRAFVPTADQGGARSIQFAPSEIEKSRLVLGIHARCH